MIADMKLTEYPEQGRIRLKPNVGVRATDVATGISAAVDCDRRQYRNKTMAVALVRAMVSAKNG